MKILVTGFSGQLGFDVVRVGTAQGFEMIGIDRNDVDLTHLEAVKEYVHQLKPDAIIHCAAYTAVDKAEDDRENCWKVNVDASKNLAEIAKSLFIKLVYISTDYVYEGNGDQPFIESDETNPQGYYGLTKNEGEKAVQQLLDQHFIVRISWVFGINGNNFVKTMLRLAETKSELSVVGDQIGSPTYTLDLSKLLIDMVQTDKYGIYHATNEGFCSWAEFATEIFNIAEKNTKVTAITSEEYPTRAVRPKNSRLSKQKLIDNGFNPLPHWKDALNRYIKDLERGI